MVFEIDSPRIPLAACGLARLRDAQATRIVCETGTVWITIDNDSRDIVLSLIFGALAFILALVVLAMLALAVAPDGGSLAGTRSGERASTSAICAVRWRIWSGRKWIGWATSMDRRIASLSPQWLLLCSSISSI